jgi:hypothetical protein
MMTPLMSKKTIIIALTTCSFLLFEIISEVGVFQCAHCFISNGVSLISQEFQTDALLEIHTAEINSTDNESVVFLEYEYGYG